MRFVLLASVLTLVACQQAPSDPEPPPEADPRAAAASESPAMPDQPAPADSDSVTVVFFGDSLTAGYGLETPQLAYPALVGEELTESGVPVQVVNAGVSGETTAGGRSRIAWTLRNATPDVFVLALGANDGLRGVDPAATEANLRAILDAVREAAPDAGLVVAGMEALPNYGADYTDRFREVFPSVAQDYGATLIPFLLDGVAGVARLNQADGIHPTPEGQEIIAEIVAEAVTPLATAAAG